MHISEQIAAVLVSQGWSLGSDSAFRKKFATGGSYGSTTKTLLICEFGRWLERLDGWGVVEKDVDLRDFPDAPEAAIAAVLAA
jgi:hypothetical protein